MTYSSHLFKGDVVESSGTIDRCAALDESEIEEARVDPSACIEYCFSDKHGSPLRQASIHREIQNHVTCGPGSADLVEVSRDTGKCLIAGTMLTTWDGRQVPIEEWRGGRLLSLDLLNSGDFIAGLSTKSESTGVVRCFRIHTVGGLEITASWNHPFLRQRRGRLEWSKAELLCAGSRVAVERGRVLRFDVVASVEAAGNIEAFDVEVPGPHNFVANGFVVHNTTQGLGRLLFELGNHPNENYKIVCEHDKAAVKRLDWIREQIERNGRLRKVFPHMVPGRNWAKTMLTIQRDDPSVEPSIEACGVTGSATGSRAGGILFDDPVGRRNALTIPALRQQVRTAMNADWLNLLEPSSWAAVLCTGWTTDDWVHDAKRSKAWRVLRRPTVGWKSPWPEYWTEAALRAKMRLIGEREYRRGFELIPVSGDTVTIQEAHIRYWELPPDPSRLIIFMGYDLSTGESKKGDYFASVAVGLDPEPPGRFYVLRAWHRKITILDQINAVLADTVAIRPDVIGVESTQYQAVLPRLLTATSAGLPPIHPINPRVSKSLRLASVEPQIEEGRVLFHPMMKPELVRDPERDGDLVGELTTFPLGSHDDLMDAFVHAMTLAMEYLLQNFVPNAAAAGAIGLNISNSGEPAEPTERPESLVDQLNAAFV